jgi:hypothetical protein
MKFVILILTSLLLSIRASAQQVTKTHWENGFHIVSPDKPFPLARYRAPDNPYVYANQRSHCAQAGKDLRICKTISGAKLAFILELKGAQIGEWPTSTDNGGDSKFEVLKGDLDGDRIEEIVIANLAGISNGMGIHTWTISIFQNPQVFGFQPPLEFSVEEFGARGTFITHPGDRHCQILVTEWRYLDHPKRGNGMYIIGRWYKYKEGSLIPIKERATVLRRYLYGFAEHVARTQDDPGVPLRWFKHFQTETIGIDPAALGKETTSATGVIKKVILPGSEDGYTGLKIEINLDSGENRVYQYSVRDFEDTDEYFFRFGSKSERIYPQDYNPKSLSDWLIGRKVNIAAYELSILGSRLGTRQIIWLLNR